MRAAPASRRFGAAFADELRRETGIMLRDPGVPWHTERSRVHELAAALGSLTAATGKIGTDVVLLARSEVREGGEGGDGEHGGSSAMQHKRNAVAAVLLRASAVRTPELVATLLSAGGPEHERGAGSWHAEWAVLRKLLSLTGGAANRAATLLEGLEVDTAGMRANLVASGPAVVTENVANRLPVTLGPSEAQRIVRAAVTTARHGRGVVGPGIDLRNGTRVGTTGPGDLREVLAADPTALVTLGDAGLADAHDPAGHLGASDQLIDHTLDRLRAHGVVR